MCRIGFHKSHSRAAGGRDSAVKKSPELRNSGRPRIADVTCRVEGTMELGAVMAMATRLGGNAPGDRRSRYLDVLSGLSAGDVEALEQAFQ